MQYFRKNGYLCKGGGKIFHQNNKPGDKISWDDYFISKNIQTKTKLKINPSEVEDTVWIPLKILKAMVKGSPRETVKFDKNYKDYVFRYKGYKIWGMTGKILYYFLNNIKQFYFYFKHYGDKIEKWVA